MKNYITIILVFIGQFVFAQSTLKFSTNSSEFYTFNNFSEFVEKEIRTKFSRATREYFTVNIIGKTSAGIVDTIMITMESRFLYLTAIDGNKIASNVSRYTNDDLVLSTKSIQESFDNATDFKKLELKEQQDVLKTFAFILAETARFEDVENALNNIIKYDCSFHWEDYKLLLRRWKTISIFANSVGDISDEAVFGGSRAILIVPITEKNVLSYDNKVKSGWRVVRKYGSQAKDKPVNIPDENQCAF